MNGYQLWHALRHCPVTQNCFNGIFAPDTLDNLKHQPSLLICNTDYSFEKGTHWLALFFDDRGNGAELFDSMGHPINYYAREIEDFVSLYSPVCKNLIERIQPPQTSLCGHYCLYYAYYRCLGHSMESIVNNMPSACALKYVVYKLYDLIPSELYPVVYQCCLKCT